MIFNKTDKIGKGFIVAVQERNAGSIFLLCYSPATWWWGVSSTCQ